MKKHIPSIALLVGLGLIAAGVALIYRPAGLIVAGAAIAAIAYLTEDGGDS